MSKRRLEIDAQVKKLLASCKTEEEKIHRFLRIAQQYLYIEEHCEAEKYLLRYLKAKPESHEAHKLVGELYLKLRRYQDAYDSLTRSYRLNESKDVLANICQAAPHASIALTTKQEWLKKAEVTNVSQSSLLSLKEAVLREGDSSVQELEDVLKEQSALHPLSPEAQIKLLVFYAEANRFEECVKVILRVEDKQELRNSPQWYRECQDALNKIRASKSIPYDQTLALLHLHISQRLTLGLITDPFFNVDKDKGSVGLEPFFKQLEIFDNLLNEALSNEQWYREGLWSFVLDHFIGQLFFLFALSMLRRADESNQEDTYKARGQALMFCALQYKPKKLGDSWFTKLDEDYKKLLTQIHFDGCYRTTSCYFCLANTSTDAEFPERVKIAVSGNAAIKFVTERLIQGKAIAAVYNQNVLSKACTKLPDRSSIAAYESKSCVAFAWSLEHIVWFLLNGAEMPTEKIFSLLPMVPNMIDAAHTPSQSDIDAFLSAVVAAVKVFGSKAIIKPLVPREIVHRVFTTTKQQNIWDALYRAFVKKATVGRDLITPKKIINDGLEIVRGRDAKKSMPVYYLVRIARDLRDKGHKKPPYFGAAVNYFKIVLARLDEHQTSQPSIGGGRASTSSLFELPKTMAACEDVGGYRDEARLEIGKFMLHCGELENARAILELIHNPMGYLYYAKTAKKLCEKFFAEGDIETGECILEKAKTLLNKGLRMARAEPDVSEKLKAELVSLEQTASDTAATFGMTLNSSGTSQPDTTSLKEIDMAKFETLLRDQTAKIETELAEMKAMQTKFVDTLAQMLAEQKLICSQAKAAALTNSETLAQMLAEQKLICSQAKAAALTNSDMMVKLTQLSQQLTRVEEQINIPQATTDYVDYQETSSTRTQQYQSGGLIIPPGAGLPQFNLTMVQHPSAQTPLVAGASGRTLSSTPTAKDEAPSCKIRFESHGVVYEKPLNRDVPFVAICPDLCQICVFEAPNGNTPFRCLCAVNASSQIVVNHDLNRVTFQTFETRDGQVNVQWTAGDKCYYIEFADWTIQPGEILMKALQACGLPVLPAAHAAEPSPVKENIFLASALSKSPLKDPAVEALSRIGRADENSKSSFFSTPFATPAATLPSFTGVAPTSSTGILPTPVAPTAPPPSTTSASPFSFSFNKPNVFTSSGNTNTGGLSNPPVSTFGGFTFSTTPVTAPLKTSPSSDNVKTPEKPKTDAPNPFSGFSFGLTKSEDQKPALGGWPTTTTAPLTSITAKTTFSFSAPTTAVPTIASSPSGQKDVAANDEQGAADAEGEDYECTAQFRPVIELPQLVETKTGEEGEDVKFCERAKLYRYDTETHEWKERGLGEMKILRNQTTGKYRVLMRREQVLKICANHQIIPGLKLMPRKKPTEYTWAAPDFADGEQKNEQFVVRFKTKEQAEKFREVFEEGLVSAQSMSPVKPQASKAEAPSTTTESKPLPSLSELFKPAAGSWSCGGCYVDNKSDAATCIACGTPNPSKATQPSGGGASSGAAAVSSPFKFGIQAAVKEEKKEEKLPSLADSFKSAPNSWNCTICYASNSPSSDKCSACQTVKPGKTPTGPFKFGLSTPSVFGSSDGDLSGKSQVSKAPISTTFTFGTTPATSVAAQPATGFVFGQTVNTSPNAAAKTPTKVTFAAQPTTIPELSPDFTFGFPQQHEFSFEKRQSDDEDDQVVESQDRDFAPAVASLPPEIEVVTGEEGQEVLYCQRAKLFRFVNKEWKERGLGDFKILRDPNTLKIRLTMRREKVHKVCLNHYLTKDIEFNMLKNDRSIKWQALDFSEGEIEPTLFAIRVRTVEIACEMLDAILSAQKGVCGTPVNCSTPKVEQPMSAVKPRVLFEETVDAGESSAVSSSDSVEIIKVEKACEADVRRARELMLPDHFFLYESRKHQCKGCRGCESDTTEEDSPVTAEKSSVVAKKSPVVAEKSPVTAEKSPVVAEKSPVTAKNEAAVKPKKVSQTKSPQSTEKVAPTSVDESVVTPVKLEQQTKTPPKAAPVFGAPPAFGTVPVEQTRNENLKPLEASSTTADSGFVFGAGSTMSFSALAASSASSGFAKPKGENPWSNSSQPTSFFSAFSKTGAGSNTTSQSDDTTQAEDTDEVEPSKDIHFEPVIPMPELITVQTGEEQDEVLYSQRAKLYVFHAQTSEWKERAIGDAKILRCSDGRARIVVRRDTVHKVACNHYITDSMELKPLATATNSVTWSAVDFAENDPTPQLFALKVKTEARLNDFKKIFEEEVERARKAKEGEHLEQKQKPSDVGEDLEDFEIVKCSPDGVVTTRTEASEERGGEDNEYVYEKDEDEEAGDEDAGDEDSDTYYDDDDVLFTALVNFSEEVPIGENQWTNLGPGILRVVYDDEVFGHVIHLSDQETDTEFAETIIALQTSLRETGRKGIWMAVDTKQKPSVRRRFCAEFSSDEDLKSFALVFNEGKETAVQTGIVENCDQPPWMRSEAKP